MGRHRETWGDTERHGEDTGRHGETQGGHGEDTERQRDTGKH